MAGNNIIIKINNEVFKKQKHWESAIKIEQLSGWYVYATWGEKFIVFGNGIFQYMLINIETFTTQVFSSTICLNGLSALGSSKTEGWVYAYYYDEEIRITDPFRKPFEDGKKYQINSLSSELGETIYEIKHKVGQQ